MIWLAALLIQDTCESCHGEPLEAFGSSIHFQKGLDCKSCHGVDSIDSVRTAEGKSPHLHQPTFKGKPKDVVAFCGACHPGVSETFASGLHGKPKKGKPLDCLACHSHHGTRPARSEELSKWCYACHKGDASIEAAGRLLTQTRASVAAIEQGIRSREPLRGTPGFDLGPDERRLDAAARLLEGLRELQHGVSIEKMRASKDRAAGLAVEAAESLQEREASVARRPFYVVLWVGLLALTGGLGAAKIYRVSRS